MNAQDPVVGSWHGYWARSGDTLLVTMEIRPGDSPNRYQAMFSSDRLRVEGIPFDSAERAGCCKLRLELRGDATTSHFDGVLNGDTITGTFTEAGASGTFALRRARRSRPTPREEEVQFNSDTVRLRGTLILPSTPPPFPAVVMAHGSGAEGRFANRFLARQFANAGIAALIFDKRGVGASTGNWRTSGFEELAADIGAGVAMLRRRPDVRADRIGLYGHSQGGTVLPLSAAAAQNVAFLIASAASGVPMDSAERFSVRNAVGVARLPAHEAALANAYIDAIVDVAYRGEPRQRLDSLAKAFAGRSWVSVAPGVEHHYWSFSRRIAGYDPLRHWMRVRAPVLIMFGSADERVPVQPSIEAIKAALKGGGNAAPTVCVYPGANHTFRVRQANDVWPRSARGYVEDIVGWTARAAGSGVTGRDTKQLSAACR